MFATTSLEAARLPWPAVNGNALPARNWAPKLRVLLIGVDTIAIGAAVAVAFFLLVDLADRVTGSTSLAYWMVAPVVAIAWIVTLDVTESRDHRTVGTGLEEYRRVIKASLIVFGGLAIACFALRISVSRGLFAITFPLGLCALLAGRWTARRYLNRLRTQARALTPALIIGSGPSVAELLTDLARRPEAGYRAHGVCPLSDLPAQDRPRLDALMHHSPAALRDAATFNRYGAVIVAEGLSREDVRSLAWTLEARPIELMFQPRLVDVAGPRMKVHEVEGLALMHVDLPTFTGARLVVKRAFDVLFSVLALVLLAPVFFVLAVAIKLDDGGPVFFRQQRIGLRGEEFMIHKFRTMCLDAEARVDALIAENGGQALLFKLVDDPRVTRLGRVLRKLSLDELPQFWSALRGGMSIVGPRPQVAREVAEYTDVHHRRLLIKPGITGLWQVSGRSDLSLEDSIRLDLRYVENWSLAGDLTIIVKTVRVVLRSSGAC